MAGARLATFFSHFGAVRFRRLARERGVPCELMPVPRALSSSCGTCARFEGEVLRPGEDWPEEVEMVVAEKDGGGYEVLWES